VLIAALAGVLAGGGRAAEPRLQLRQAHPVTVHGTGFHPRERVRVSVHVGGHATAVRHPRAGGHGRFTTTFRRLSIGHCDELSITATDSSGRRAVLRRRPACPPT
jgi:hypothetical protein